MIPYFDISRQYWVDVWANLLMKRAVYELATKTQAPIFHTSWFLTDEEHTVWWQVIKQ